MNIYKNKLMDHLESKFGLEAYTLITKVERLLYELYVKSVEMNQQKRITQNENNNHD
jgi:hypothetical protein